MPTTATLGSMPRLYPARGRSHEALSRQGSGGPRRTPVEHALLVPLALFVDGLLDVFGLADVLEHLAAPLARGFDDEVTRPDHPLEDALLESHVVHGLERDLHRRLRDPTLAVDHPVRGHDEVGGEEPNGVAHRPEDEPDDAGHDDRPEQDVVAGFRKPREREAPRHGDQDRDEDRSRQRDRMWAEIEDQLLALDEQP